uniref:YitT family protein n=1 Tax=Paracoccus sp. TaxID=267 RepID=UPI00289A4C77
MSETTPAPKKHSFIEDAQGLAYGSFMASVGVLILTHLGFVTGQTAGLAVMLSYSTGYSFAPIFFLVNLPFYWLGYPRIGLAFT